MSSEEIRRIITLLEQTSLQEINESFENLLDNGDLVSPETVRNFKKALEQEPWWGKSRNHVGYFLQTMQDMSNSGELTQATFRRLSKICKFDAPKIREIVGYSVGFKKSRSSKLIWVDVHGAKTPPEASRRAKETYNHAGYNEYGISPIIRWREQTPEEYDRWKNEP